MSISLVNVEDLQEHLLGVFERSAHHAGEVNEVLLTLSGAILWRKNPKDAVKVNTKEGAGGNVIWFRVDNTRYVLLYSHEERVIKLVEGGRKGTLIQTFTNATSTNEVARVFATLGKSVPELSAARKGRREDRDPNAPKDPQRKQERLLAKAAKADKDPAAKEARQLAKAAKDPNAKEARLQAKAAKAEAREAKVKAQRDQRRNNRADDKAARAAAIEAAASEAAAAAVAEAEAAAAAAAAQRPPAPARARRTKPAQPSA